MELTDFAKICRQLTDDHSSELGQVYVYLTLLPPNSKFETLGYFVASVNRYPMLCCYFEGEEALEQLCSNYDELKSRVTKTINDINQWIRWAQEK